nr:hypothetical protein [Tanacetum cinerariifolium]
MIIPVENLWCKDRPCAKTFGETFDASIVPAGTILAPKRSYSSTTIGTPTNEAHYQLRLNVFRQKGQPRLENTTRLHLESNSQKLQEVSKHLIMQWLAGQGFVQLVLFGLSASTNISSLARGSFVSTVE